jgi:hypothetical protein
MSQKHVHDVVDLWAYCMERQVNGFLILDAAHGREY